MSKEFGKKEVEAVTEIAKTLTEGKTKFYVGQLVESYNDGRGTVESLKSEYTSYPIRVIFENGKESTFALTGKHVIESKLRIFDIRPVEIEAVDIMSGICMTNDWPKKESSEDKPMTATEVNERKLPKCFNDAIVHIDWSKTEEIHLREIYSKYSALNLETTEEIDLHKCLEEGLLKSRNPPEQQPLYTGTRDKLIGSILNGRMLDADISPIPLTLKPIPEKTELTAKCALCGEPCKPRNGEKFYSHCVGGCK